MEKLLIDIKSPYWWVSIVIVGILVNILSSVLFKKYEVYQSKYSEKKRLEIKAKALERQQKVQQLIGDKEKQIFHHLNINSEKQSALEFFLLGIIIINTTEFISQFGFVDIVVYPIIYTTSYYFIWKGLRLRNHAKYELAILNEAVSSSQ